MFAATMAPVVAIAPLAGQLVDRIEIVRLLALSSRLAAGVAGALAFAGDLAALLGLTALLAGLGAVAQPAEFALIPHVAAPDRLARRATARG